MTQTLISLLWLVLIVGAICTILYWLVKTSPLVEPFKGWAMWGVLAIGVLIVLFRLLALAGISS